VNRALVDPEQYHITSFQGQSKEATAKQIGFSNWDVHFHEEPYYEVFDKSKIVYLSSESHNVLTEVSEDKVYVIGGLVDHNAKKGLCFQLAEERGIAHARLPLKEWVDMEARGVLSINQVFSIVANVSLGMPWQTAILNAIPARKNAQAKQDDNSYNTSDEDGEGS
jgi:Trm5-related predicted tRNA methylase